MTKDENPKKTARREAQRRRRLPPDACCIRCGETAPEALEQHHPMGREHQRDLTATLCKNCHAKATEGQLREEVPLLAANNFPDRLASILKAVAAFFRFLADAFDGLVEEVRTWAAARSEGS